MARIAKLLRMVATSSTLHFCLLSAPFFNAAHASNFEIAPVVLELSDTRQAGAIRFVNKDDHEMSLQVRTNEWHQKDGEDVIAPTPANAGLLVSPPIFTLAPGAAQTIRVVAREKGVTAETAYRLYIDEIPAVAKEPAINFKFRVSMPIFMEPADSANQKMEWRADTSSAPQVVLHNAGNRRIKLLNIELTLPSGKKMIPRTLPNSYTLVGGSRTYLFAPNAEFKPGATVKLSATMDAGPYDTSIVVSP